MALVNSKLTTDIEKSKLDIETVHLIVQAGVCLQNFTQPTSFTSEGLEGSTDNFQMGQLNPVIREKLLKQALEEREISKMLNEDDNQKIRSTYNQFYFL